VSVTDMNACAGGSASDVQIAAGNGEQVIARDVHRLARRLNTPRLLTW